MKKVILIGVSLVIAAGLLAQEVSETRQLVTRKDYLDKSRQQKTGAIILLSAGGAALLGGSLIVLNSIDLGLFDDNYQSNDGVGGAILMVVGAGAMLGSIPVFISSHRNKVRAINMSVQNEHGLQIQNSIVRNRFFPALSLKINI